MESEDATITRLLKPVLKEEYFVKTSVRVDRLYSKLKTEGALSLDEINIKHPFHPDIDVLFWAKEYSGEPVIYASEVKYFRLRDGMVYPNIYEGLGEALMLLTYGVDYVSLWHFFDPEISSEIISRYRDLTQNLVTNAPSPINYQSFVLSQSSPVPFGPSPSKPKDKEETLKDMIAALRYGFLLSFKMSVWSLKPNPIRNRWDTSIMRAIIKKSFRIVNR